MPKAKGPSWDFDAAWSEMRAAPLTVRAFGEDVPLPSDIPALLVLTVERARVADPDADIDDIIGDDEMREVFDAVFGAERVKRWLAAGAGFSQFGSLLQGVLMLYAGVDPDEVRRGEAPAPVKGAPRSGMSSASGRSSKRTSPGNTRSTSSKRSGTG